MSMVKCPECGKDVSNTAYQCPACGYTFRPPPLPAAAPVPAPVQKSGLSTGCIVGLVIGGLGVLAIPVIALLTAIAIPAFLQYRNDARHAKCINNMRLIDHAKEVWAIKTGATTGQAIAESPEAIWVKLSPYVDSTNVLSCPQARGKPYLYGPIDTAPRCPVENQFTEHVYTPN